MGYVAIVIIRAVTNSTVVARKVVNNSIAFTINLAYNEERLTVKFFNFKFRTTVLLHDTDCKKCCITVSIPLCNLFRPQQ